MVSGNAMLLILVSWNTRSSEPPKARSCMLPQTAPPSSSRDLPGTVPVSPWLRALIWGEAAVLLALAQMLWAGYQLGTGNQSIQIPFLQKLHDASLYPHDAMVNGTLGEYPSYFFVALAWSLAYVDLPSLYLGLHIATTAGVFLAVAALGRWLFNDEVAGLIAGLMLLAGHLHALAGETLYSAGFTHTWATFPLALAVLALYGRGRVAAALALAGLLFNLHALTASYVLAMVLGASFVNSLVRPRRLEKGFIPGLMAFALLASPTMAMMVRHRQEFDATWLSLMHIRSADHSFPSAWWQAGALDVPRFAMIVALGLLAMSHVIPRRTRRMLLGVALATGAMFLAGYLLTEVWPVPLVVRAQLFRASRLVVILAVVLVGFGLVQSLRALGRSLLPNSSRFKAEATRGFEGSGQDPAAALPSPVPQKMTSRLAAVLNAVIWAASGACLGFPPLLAFLPWVLLLATVIALALRQLAWWQAAASATSLLIALAAWQTIHFDVPGFGGSSVWTELARATNIPQAAGLVVVLAVVAATIWLVGVLSRVAMRRTIVAAALPMCLASLIVLLPQWTTATPDSWDQVQAWARRHTPIDAVFLTPIAPGGFRIGSQRSVVGEWRDGTQLYFSAAFATTWWQRMNELQRGQVLDSAGTTLLSRGKPLGTSDDQTIIDVVKHYGATHVVLPTHGQRQLVQVFTNADWTIYEPRIPEPVIDPDEDPLAADDRFIRETVLPNIEKYRKSEARIQVLDTTGRPINDAEFDIVHLRHEFGFGCSLPFFAPKTSPSMGDYMPPPVTSVELDRFKEVFNFSMIPFSSKWMHIEAVEGQRDYSELDQYVQWCADHQVTMEFHFLSGYLPGWLRRRPEQEQAARFEEHAQALVERYADRIKYFQVVNEKILIRQSPAVFNMIRQIAPQAKLGIADCARFYPDANRRGRQPADRDLLRGLEEVRWLKQQGVKLDYFGFHAHRPFGLWASATDIYKCLDAFAAEDVKLHITEFGMPLDKPMLGPLRQEAKWTDEEQAAYYRRFYTIVFSHPAADVLNMWLIGPSSWMPESGLLDREYQPKPAFYALRELIKETWHTHVMGNLGLDGTTSFRGFHGAYRLTLRLPNERTTETTFSVASDQTNNLRFILDPATMKLELAK